MENFKEKNKESIKLLKQYIPIVSKVHGGNHPKFFEVEKEFNLILDKLQESIYDLNEEFINIRKITSNYTLPNDVCESYETVYKLIEELDKSYNA